MSSRDNLDEFNTVFQSETESEVGEVEGDDRAARLSFDYVEEKEKSDKKQRKSKKKKKKMIDNSNLVVEISDTSSDEE